MKIKKSQPNILDNQDKKILDITSKLLNSYGMDYGNIRLELDSHDWETTDFEDMSFDNNYNVNIPKILIPVLDKIRNFIVNNVNLGANGIYDVNYEIGRAHV